MTLNIMIKYLEAVLVSFLELTLCLLTFGFPFLVYAFIFFQSVILFICEKLNYCYELFTTRKSDDPYLFGRQLVCWMWKIQGYIFHSHEIFGKENIPQHGGALLVYYHGALPMDYYYIVSDSFLGNGRLIHGVVAKFLFYIPMLNHLMRGFHCEPGTRESCVKILKEGKLLAIAPGGVYEALFSNNDYEILWQSRFGFVKVAKSAEVPIIPVFTENIRESFQSLRTFSGFWQWLYKKTYLPICPIYGGWPVKMRTWIGKPIYHEPTETIEDIRGKVEEELQNLIVEHQNLPGSVWNALYERLPFNRYQ